MHIFPFPSLSRGQPGSGRITEYPRVDAGGPGHPYALSTTRSQLTLPLGERHVPAVTVECEAQVLSLTTHASHSAHVRPLSTAFSFFNAGEGGTPEWNGQGGCFPSEGVGHGA